MAKVIDAERRIQTICLLLLTTFAVGAGLYFLSPVLIPFVLAVFLVYCLTPVIDVQMSFLRIGRTTALITTILLGTILLVLLWLTVWAAVQEISANTGEYETQLNNMLDRAADTLPLEKFGLAPDDLHSILRFSRETTNSLFTKLVGSVMSLVSNGLLVLIFIMFMMAGKRTAPRPGTILEQLETQIKGYVVAKVLLSAATGLLVGLTLKMLSVKFALTFGVLAFLLNFIPNIGSIVATLLPLPVVVLNPEMGPISKLLAIALPGAIQMVVGNVIEPKVMGKSLDLHPVVVLLGLIFFGMIWGIVGMFLATPIVALVKIILERIELTAPVGRLLSARQDA